MSSLFGIAAGGDTGFYPFKIDNSLRFYKDDSTDLSRTPSSESNVRTFTFSAWVKRGDLDSRQGIFNTSNSAGNDFDLFEFQSTGTIRLIGNNNSASVQYNLITDRLFRDVARYLQSSGRSSADIIELEAYRYHQEIILMVTWQRLILLMDNN